MSYSVGTYRNTRYPPEPFASLTDIMQAGVEIENGIHASNVTDTINALNAANNWLNHAKGYFQIGIQAGDSAYQPLYSLVEAAMKSLTQLKDGVTSSNLSSYQTQHIYAYQATLGYLYNRVQQLVASTY